MLSSAHTSSRPEAAPAWHPRQVMRRLLAAALPRRVLLVRGPQRTGQVCLTFDDGPHPQHTPRVLEILKDRGVHATFFVIGRHAQQCPDLLRRIASEGHAIGHHSFSHPKPGAITVRELLDELTRTQQLFDEVTQRPSRLFRPPHGKLTPATLWALRSHGFSVVLWNRDSKDYQCQSPQELLQWARERPLHGGDVLLMHDTNPHTPEVLPRLIESSQARGLSFCTIPVLLENHRSESP